MSLFKSIILNGEQQCSELLKLCEFSPNDKFTLLYRGTRDDFGSNDFHSKCDGHSNTLTILKANGSGFIFGGFTTVAWGDITGRVVIFLPISFILSFIFSFLSFLSFIHSLIHSFFHLFIHSFISQRVSV